VSSDYEDAGPSPPSGRLARLVRHAWWLHSFWALAFGVGVMLFARKGIAHADKVLVVAGVAWLFVFVAVRFIVGPGNTSPDEALARRGLRVVTHYVIKNLFQQMFFFQVPLYASSATWALDSPSWWLPVLLGVCAVLSTLDVVFDRYILPNRPVAALLYGVCLFALLNLILPLVFELSHAHALLIAALAAPPATALLTFRVRTVLRPVGLLLTLAIAGSLGVAAWLGRAAIPPAPLAMPYGAVGHGVPGQYEVLPGKITRLRANQLDGLRCVTELVDPSAGPDVLVHVWRFRGQVVATLPPVELASDEPRAKVLRTQLTTLPADPLGAWSCSLETSEGQIIGRVAWTVEPPVAAPAAR
jgi:hypothetical protein